VSVIHFPSVASRRSVVSPPSGHSEDGGSSDSADSLAQAAPASPTPPVGAPPKRHSANEFPPGNPLATQGGTTRANNRTLFVFLGLRQLQPEYVKQARWFKKQYIKDLKPLAGGKIGRAPRAMIHSAVIQMAASRYLTDKYPPDDAKHMSLASRLSNDARSMLTSAHDLALKERDAREGRPTVDVESALSAILGHHESSPKLQ
jgi:hypothetical protein